MKKLLVMVMFIILISLMISPVTYAATIKSGEEINIGKSETIQDDLYVFGGIVSIDGTINGDLVVAAGTVTIDGTVEEDLIVAGGNVIINGYVGDDIKVSGGTVVIRASVADDVMAAGGTINLAKDGQVGGDFLAAGGTNMLSGSIGEDVKISGGDLNMSGTVDGDMTFEGDTAKLGPNAEIGGDFTYKTPKKAKISNDAVIGGKTTHKLPEQQKQSDFSSSAIVFGILFALFWFVIWTIGSVIVGVILVSLAPRGIQTISSSMSSSVWASLGIGFVLLFGMPIVAMILIFTLIGIPLGLILFIMYMLGVYFSTIFVGFWLGQKIIKLFKKKGEPSPLWSMILGVLVISIILAIPIIGALISLLAIIWGLGGIAVGSSKLRKSASTKGIL